MLNILPNVKTKNLIAKIDTDTIAWSAKFEIVKSIF